MYILICVRRFLPHRQRLLLSVSISFMYSETFLYCVLLFDLTVMYTMSGKVLVVFVTFKAVKLKIYNKLFLFCNYYYYYYSISCLESN